MRLPPVLRNFLRGRDHRLIRPDAPRHLTHAELEHIKRKGTCPYCHGVLWTGSEGGMCVNLACDTPGCWSRFNYCYVMGQFMGDSWLKPPIEVHPDRVSSEPDGSGPFGF